MLYCFESGRFVRDCVKHCVDVGGTFLAENGDGAFNEILKNLDKTSAHTFFVSNLEEPLNMRRYDPSGDYVWKDGRMVKELPKYDAVALCVANAVAALSWDEKRRFKVGAYLKLGYGCAEAAGFLGLMRWLAASVDRLWALKEFLPGEMERVDKELSTRSKSGGAA